MDLSRFLKKVWLLVVAFTFFPLSVAALAQTEREPTQSHIVSPGDNLWKISSKYLLHGVSFPHIAKRNSGTLTNPDIIHPGDVLNIPKCETNFECKDRKNFTNQIGDSQKVRSSFGTLILRNGWKSRWKALDVTLKAVDEGNTAGGWDVSAGINREAIATLLSSVVGSRLVHTGKGLLKGTEVSIGEIALVPSLASLDALVKIQARKGPITLELMMEGAILVSRIEYDRDEENKEIARVVLRLEPLKVQPLAKIGKLSVKANRFWSKLAPDLAKTLLNPEIFETEIVIPAEFAIKTGINEVRSTETGHDAVLTYQVSMEKVELKSAVSYAAPVYSGNAIWLMGKLRTEDASDIIPDAVPRVNEVELRLAVQEQYELLQTKLSPELVAFGTADKIPRLTLRVQDRLFEDLTGKLASLTPQQRRLSFNLTRSTGHLTLEKWRDKILGEGGIKTYVRNCEGCAQATVNLGELSINRKNGTLGLSLPVNASGSLAVGLHIDPLVGGGVGTSVGIDVNTRNTQILDINATPLLINDAQRRGSAVLVWKAACRKLDITALTDGKVKVGGFSTNVTKIGARIKVPMQPDVLEPILLFNAKLELILFPKPNPVGKSRRARDWRIVSSNVGATITLTPRQFVTNSTAFYVDADLQVDATPRPKDDLSGEASVPIVEQLKNEYMSQRSQVAAATQAAIKAHARKSTCDTKLEIAVLVGDFEFGPNHELIKFLKNAWSDLKNGPGPNNEVVKFLHNIGINRDVQKKFGHELSLNKAGEWLKNPGDSLKRGEPGRLLDNLKNGVEKVLPKF